VGGIALPFQREGESSERSCLLENKLPSTQYYDMYMHRCSFHLYPSSFCQKAHTHTRAHCNSPEAISVLFLVRLTFVTIDIGYDKLADIYIRPSVYLSLT
jgi:hypothetical protein